MTEKTAGEYLEARGIKIKDLIKEVEFYEKKCWDDALKEEESSTQETSLTEKQEQLLGKLDLLVKAKKACYNKGVFEESLEDFQKQIILPDGLDFYIVSARGKKGLTKENIDQTVTNTDPPSATVVEATKDGLHRLVQIRGAPKFKTVC